MFAQDVYIADQMNHYYDLEVYLVLLVTQVHFLEETYLVYQLGGITDSFSKYLLLSLCTTSLSLFVCVCLTLTLTYPR